MSAALPNITGTLSVMKFNDSGEHTGAFETINVYANVGQRDTSPEMGRNDISFDAKRCSKVYHDDFAGVQPSALQKIAQIRF